jgi:hypothetical protein
MTNEHKPCEYMKYVTGNGQDLIKTGATLVACVYCINTYKTESLRSYHNCLWCSTCHIDAVMVVDNSPLKGLTEEEQKALLEKWHIQGFKTYN